MWRQRSAPTNVTVSHMPHKSSDTAVRERISAAPANQIAYCLVGWVSEVRQIALKEEGIGLKGHARRLKGEVPCLRKPDD